ncbi:MAG: hypothetical protein ACXV8M_14175 [Candidatus Angelobacter sp.]
MRNSVWILVPSICLLAPAIAAGQTGGRDLKITTRHSYSGSAYATTTYYSGENSRTETQIFSGNVKGHRRAQIRKKGAESIQVYDLDLDAHVYASYQTDLRGVVPGAKPIALKPSGKTYVINTDVVDTGERKEMFGHIARHLISKEKRIGGPENCYGGNTESEIDGWYIDDEVLPLPQRPKAGVSTHLVGYSAGAGSVQCSDKIEAHRTGPRTGFSLKKTTTLKGETTLPDNSASSYSSVSQTEVVEFVEAPLDSALFEVPADFKKVKEIIDPTQRLQALTYWERFKSELWSFFH